MDKRYKNSLPLSDHIEERYKNSLPLSDHIQDIKYNNKILDVMTTIPSIMPENLKIDILSFQKSRPHDTDLVEINNRISKIIAYFQHRCANRTLLSLTISEVTSCASRKTDYETFLNLFLQHRRGGKYNYSKNVTRRRNYNKRKNKSQRYIRKDKKRK